ncbi:MAG: hypothetical protein Q7U38_01720 [Methylobacter sp.]|nr:hypothetical protein [Methylobacter sp.]MDP2099422.1 hypothetical protein [Methylobacter sp.]MDP2429927.1 hypothetical protein [Methylobacter sp.]MDP3053190.1 hypothetical protein [Methylobacter sp.]MDP3360575.1 hypothetical protein [Methylobacter sp.]
MSLISISEASELTGKSIPTIYRHIKDGNLTQTDNKIDTTELLRLFGSFKSSTDYLRENEQLRRSNADLKQDKEKLYQINDLLRRSNADLKQDKEKLYRIIASQEKWLSTQTVQSKPADTIAPHETAPNEPIMDESLTQRLVRKLFF